MKGFLNFEQIEYVLFHLNNHITLNSGIRESLVFIKSPVEISEHPGKIIFILSEKELRLNEIVYINGIPVLFPNSSEKQFFYFQNGNIIFNHDLFKSVFYLLSGYQECNNQELDSFGRFLSTSSIQSKLKINNKPVVNYYFAEIIEGIEEFCLTHNLEFKKREQSGIFTFFLTHDVDRIKYFNINSLLYTIKILFRQKKDRKKNIDIIKEIFRIAFHIINIFDNKDPFWNFEELTKKEKELEICSTYFFLPKDQKHVDSYYNIDDKKIGKLIEMLKKEGNEIGLHGTVRSHTSLETLSKIVTDFLKATKLKKTGIRQHRLMWQHPLTAINHNIAGISYDSTLGFADHEGFRNSYCHPFKLFDFENNLILSYWEIPLNVMDSTLFYYRKLSTEEATEAVSTILKEIKKFNGVFTLLWHNSYFNESDVPGITDFYNNLLGSITAEKPEILTGLDIISKFEFSSCNDKS
ncbi:MAG TPA: polysaccharide deacetylase family protein [Bacteroidales bacterium]|nr:polysaccharide deacetylase family protein [Bacteroidales bacterium]